MAATEKMETQNPRDSSQGETACKARGFYIAPDNLATPAQVERLSVDAPCYTCQNKQEKSTWRNSNHSGNLFRSSHSSHTTSMVCSRLRRSNIRRFFQQKQSHISLTILR